MSKQTRLGSLVEAIANTALGFIISFGIQLTLNYAYDVEMAKTTAMWFVFWFTIASIARSYLIRRLWEMQWWKIIRVKWEYRNINPDICCCGSMIGEGRDICYHGGCRSAKEYAITSELN